MTIAFPTKFPAQVGWREHDMDHSLGWYTLPPDWPDLELGTVLELEEPRLLFGQFYLYAVVAGKKSDGGVRKVLLQEGFSTAETAKAWTVSDTSWL